MSITAVIRVRCSLHYHCYVSRQLARGGITLSVFPSVRSYVRLLSNLQIQSNPM